MKILDAIYNSKSDRKLISLREITTEIYMKKYGKKIFCATRNCHARLCFVAKSGNKNYLRTWRESKHAKECPFFFDKEEWRTGIRKSGTVIGIVSGDQIKKSLKEAYEMESISEEERWKQAEEKRQSLTINSKKPKVNETSQQLTLTIVSDPTKMTVEAQSTKGRLYKRDVDALKETDVGQTRTVTGRIHSVEVSNGNPAIRVIKNNILMNVHFADAFFAHAEQYYDLFTFVERLRKDMGSAIINATGEVGKSKKNDEFELIVFDRDGLLVEGMSLPSLVAYYSTEQLSF